ncbi:MAG: thioredoxin domain-containing protein [Gammaproteobacteria bacterium]|nr:thioredoxin domain-containing protein [Gammaproteobacteria bacterium]MDH5344152.1 thioredoxin domain-containing protein [Gammaproteobacteria bacterium]
MNQPNRLAGETSPYLLQHADNPVDWHPWCDEALALAREQDKPILLSVGYSACHWCHVMAHESFEDEATAKLMNELFVNIKVDREERPDIDRIYQTAHQLLTHRPGGWPLTMFMDPADQRPFFGGTYFPPDRRHGLPSFRELLARAALFFREQRDDVRAQGAQLVEIFGRLEPAPGEAVPGRDALDGARREIARSFDREHGGIGNAPKFPHPTTFDRLLRHWRASAHGAEPDVDALFMVSLTLTRMAEGGIYDQLGGGFCRYSVDRYWQIPHFEKMLYDNGPLLALYAEAALATGEDLFARVANETADWMLADMRAPNGGFWSTRDADSEGEEGRYYVWTPDEVRGHLTDDEFAVVLRHYGLCSDANFEGHWHFTVREPLPSMADDLGRPEADLRALLDRARSKLLDVRAKRVPPARDEKQLASWNALAIRGLAIAGNALGREDLVDAAAGAVNFVRRDLVRDGRLFASYKDGSARFPAYLDDHAFLADAILELLKARWNTGHLHFAVELAELLLARFQDVDSGGFYFTADDHEALMHRPKPLADDATPSGNGVAALALQRLGFLLGEPRYLDAAERSLMVARRAIDEYPHGHVSLITALEEYLDHPEIIIIRGRPDKIGKWRRSAAGLYAPRRLVFAIPDDEKGLPGALADRKPVDGETVAYRCVGSHCSLPITSFEALAGEILESGAFTEGANDA